MKRYSLLLIILFQSIIVLGQGPSTPEIKSELPTIIPPSPTVANLMKFEEVPVSNYTGVPDISIPLYSTTANHGLDVSVSLSYHPSSIKKEDAPSFTGLGWSLIAGGTISRTVRDVPDDHFSLGSTYSKLKVGIYHNNPSFGNHENNYYKIIDSLPADRSFNHNSQAINRFLFESGVKQQFDTKHDLYQFNFMGNTGRFIIEKRHGGNYEIVKLDKNNMIITYDHTAKKFEIIDTKGFKYVFDVTEQSGGSTATTSDPFDQTAAIPEHANNFDYISAFHLSKVYYGTDLVAEFKYRPGWLSETQVVFNKTTNTAVSPSASSLWNQHQSNTALNIASLVLPTTVNQTTTSITKTKKLSQIKITDRAVIDFEVLTGLSSSTTAPSIGHCLDKIKVKTWDSTTIVKEYKFDYLMAHKMFLDKIHEGTGSSQYQKHQFKYDLLDISFDDMDSDYWGYYRQDNYEDCGVIRAERDRSTDKVYCKKDVLKQIIYPTKGSAVFEYEPNDFSYIGDSDEEYTTAELTNFDSNPNNWTITFLDEYWLDDSASNNHGGRGETDQYLFGGSALPADGIFLIRSTIDSVEPAGEEMKIVKINPSNNSEIGTIPVVSGGCPHPVNLAGGFKYKLRFEWIDDSVLSSSHVSISEKTRNVGTVKAEYGGGIRIKNIYYTDEEAPELSTQDFPDAYSKKINYDYSFFGTDKSSGSLVYPKPKLMYYDSKQADLSVVPYPHRGSAPQDILYRIVSNTNNLSFLSTKGSDVGYKNVTVREEDNGWTEYEYDSPIDFPEAITDENINQPFAPTANIDYKRGNLTEERKYNQQKNIVAKKQNHYTYEDYERVTGLSTFAYPNHDCVYAGHYSTYNDYYSAISNPLDFVAESAANCEPNAGGFIGYQLTTEAYGWTKLEWSKSFEYSYNGSTQYVLSKQTDYEYNSENMKIKKTISTTSDSDTIQTKYFYPIDTEMAGEPQIANLLAANMVDTVLDIKTSLGGRNTSETKIQYAKDATTSNWLLPKYIFTKKGEDADMGFERKVKYNQYDAIGNVTEVQQENGMVMSYIWGYNKSLPIAKIDNATNVQVAAALGMALSTVNESNLTAINNLRTTLPNAMVTTLTHLPLVGVSTVTDPKGDTSYYQYDTLGRLIQIKNGQGEIVSENEYHYKN